MSQEKHYIYHITHIDNLRNIIKKAKLLSKNAMGSNYKDIAHQTVQQKRLNKIVPISPSGVLHDYVPFYFGKRSPMLYAIKNNQVRDYYDGQNPIIYLVSSAEWCDNRKLNYVFTDGHGIMDITSFYNDIKDLDKIDFEVANALYWSDTLEDNDRKRKKQSEFLVKKEFPWTGILGIVTINDEMNANVNSIYNELQPAHKPRVVTEPKWYY